MAEEREKHFSIKAAVGEETIKFVPPIEGQDSRLGHAFNFYNYKYSPEVGVQWIFEYMKNCGKYSEEEQTTASSLPIDVWKSPTWKLARIINNGNKLPQEQVDYLENNIKDALKNATTTVRRVRGEDDATVYDNMVAQARRVLNSDPEREASKVIDGKLSHFVMYDFLSEKQINAKITRWIQNYYTSLFRDLFSALYELDPEDVKSYSYLSHSDLEKAAIFIKQFIDDCERWATNKKASTVRKTRKPRVRKAIDIASKMQFMAKDNELQITSVDPSKIVGASQTWTYVPKKRLLSLYKSESDGLTISRSSIRGFDTNSSFSKKLRNPKEVIDKVLNSGKIDLRKIMESIKGKEKKVSGRINNETIIVRVV